MRASRRHLSHLRTPRLTRWATIMPPRTHGASPSARSERPRVDPGLADQAEHGRQREPAQPGQHRDEEGRHERDPRRLGAGSGRSAQSRYSRGSSSALIRAQSDSPSRSSSSSGSSQEGMCMAFRGPRAVPVRVSDLARALVVLASGAAWTTYSTSRLATEGVAPVAFRYSSIASIVLPARASPITISGMCSSWPIPRWVRIRSTLRSSLAICQSRSPPVAEREG